ncbi:MAG: M23 family metallopeptidase [Actinomycetales bacterium]|nr:M23 family metallopeptidase [Actinomycetales bacterium]
MGTGLVLPTTATLAIVSMGGNSPSVALAGNGADLSMQAQVTANAADDAELAALKDQDAPTLARGVDDRVARDSERARLDVVASENEKRAAQEAALAAGDQVIEVTAGTKSTTAAGASTSTASPAADLPAPTVGSKAWVKPLNSSYVLTSGYAWRWGRMHPAQDFAIPVGTPVKAMSSGVVILAGWSGGYGYKVEIKYWDGTVSWYAHNSSVKVKVGQTVSPGQVVSLSGNTGHSTGPHLHLEIHPGGGDGTVSPLSWLRQKGMPM